MSITRKKETFHGLNLIYYRIKQFNNKMVTKKRFNSPCTLNYSPEI